MWATAGYAVQDGAVTVDVSNLTTFTVNTGAGPLQNTVTFGSGLRLGQLYLKMYLEANSLFPAGVCPWVGTAGHILGTFLVLKSLARGAMYLLLL